MKNAVSKATSVVQLRPETGESRTHIDDPEVFVEDGAGQASVLRERMMTIGHALRGSDIYFLSLST